MGSFIPIDSITIDLPNSVGKRDAGKCEHFSIRGYVSEIRKKDWKTCWPFLLDESKEKPSLPPLHAPKYKCQCCQNFPQEGAAKDIDKDGQTNLACCSTQCIFDTNCNNAALKSATQKDPMPDTLDRRDLDLNTNLSCVSDFLQFNNEEVKKDGAVLGKIIDLETSLKDNLNHQATSVSSPKICSDFIEEVHTSRRGCEDNGVSNAELGSNLKCIDKGSVEIYNGGTPSADNQCPEELIEDCTVLGDGPTAIEANNTTDHTTGHLPPKSVACNHNIPSRNTHNMVENDFPDHHPQKFTAISHRRPRKVRLMTDILSESGDLKTEQITRRGSPSYGTSNATGASQAHPNTNGELILTNMGQNRKRKFLLGEAQRPVDMCDKRKAIEVQKEDATKYNDGMTGIGLPDAMKVYWSKSEIEKNCIMRKKSRRIQVIDNHLIPEPDQDQQRENEDTMDTADEAYASNTLSSRFAPYDLTGKGIDKLPISAPRIENDFNLSKGKGKVLQTNQELDSLSFRKKDMLRDNSFAYSGGRLVSYMPVDIPIPSAQGALSGKGVEEGLQLSLNSHLAAQLFNKKCIHQIENQLPFPLPLEEGASNVQQPKRKDFATNVFGRPSIPSKQITNAIYGKGVRCEETISARNTEKTFKAMEQPNLMKRYSEHTAEVSEQGTLDGIPMEIVELLAKNQYERCLPDVENRSLLHKSTTRRKTQMTSGNAVHGKGEFSLSKEGQKEKLQGIHKKSSMATGGENVRPGQRKTVHHFSPLDGNSLRMNNICPPQSPFGFDVSRSQNNQFPHIGSNHLGSAQNFKFNGGLEERGSSYATLQAPGGCSLHKTILQENDEASRIWTSLTSNHVSLGYDVPKKVVSQPTSANMDITSHQSGALHRQNMRRDIDLNCINLLVAGPEMLNRSIGSGTFSRVNGGYPFPGKHNRTDPHQNLRGSLDMYSNEVIPAMHLLSLMDAGKQSRTPFNVGVNAQMLKRPSYHGDCSTKLEIGTSKTYSTTKRQSSDHYSRSYSSDKSGGCFLGTPNFVTSSSTQHGMKFVRDTGAFAGRNSVESGKKEKMKNSNSAMQSRVSNQFSWPHLETETQVQHKLEVRGTHETLLPVRVNLGNPCMLNRNPADFTMPETGNAYMINGEDLKFEKSIPQTKPCFPPPHAFKQKRNLKRTKMNEPSKH
ncbi:PREDICTED: protein EMBRYONIC FLOWER 1-like [Lupinus angustifolius]|uniref:protein EMBRYONIC FLOWER 1-like n=1 Tax=Lupinus angustifolius TaxID=3871 RepID=UPI00092F85E1|nr:PREDICTED: protein EMBRYONIC FLOWER 1-like [Lupinus angustifolius]